MDQPLIGPAVAFPTPWRLGEVDGAQQVVVDATDSWVASFPIAGLGQALAELVVELANQAGAGGNGWRDSRVSAPNYLPPNADVVLPGVLLTEGEDRVLLKLVRGSVVSRLEHEEAKPVPEKDSPEDYVRRGTIQTLMVVLQTIDSLLYQATKAGTDE